MRFRDFFKLHPLFPVVVLFSVAVSVTSLYLHQYLIAITELLLGVILSFIVFLAERKNFVDLRKTVNLLNSYLDEDRDTSAIPLPVVVCTAKGSIAWYNKLFDLEVIGKNELTNKQIKSFITESKLISGSKSGSMDFEYNNNHYTVYFSKVNEDGEIHYALYFIDDTYYKNIVNKYSKTRPVLMIVSVDAMDEVSAKVSQNAFSALLSDTERMTMAWFSHYPCVLRKTGDGRFFVLTQYSVFEQMKENKFDILDDVREHRIEGISEGLTLSVGIASAEELTDADNIVRKSLDMAKGRGGDQVVINDNDNYEFFGGVASGVESRNQVQSRIVASSIEELIKHSDQVYIMGHKNTDLDALGSAIGLYEASISLGILAKIVIDEKNTMAKALYDYYNSKKAVSPFAIPSRAFSELTENTLVIITDVMRKTFAEVTHICEAAKKIVVIDHHRMSVDAINDSLIFYHEPNSSSASEMVTELIKYMPSKPKLSKQAAEALLSGIYLDTKNFTLKAGVRTFEAAAYLKDHGADTITVRKLFAATAQENALISNIVNSAVIKDKYAFAKTEADAPDVRLAAAKAADSLLDIEGVDASFVLFLLPDGSVSISARSYGRVNVQIIMEKLGGGGHQTMAAAQLKNISLNEAAINLDEAIAETAKRSTGKSNKKEE